MRLLCKGEINADTRIRSAAEIRLFSRSNIKRDVTRKSVLILLPIIYRARRIYVRIVLICNGYLYLNRKGRSARYRRAQRIVRRRYRHVVRYFFPCRPTVRRVPRRCPNQFFIRCSARRHFRRKSVGAFRLRRYAVRGIILFRYGGAFQPDPVLFGDVHVRSAAYVRRRFGLRLFLLPP